MTDDLLKDSLKLASKHDIAHLVALGIINNELADEKTKPQIQQIIFRAVYRYEKLNFELKQVCEALEKAQIPFLPLKGSVIRKYYSEPWMRTSCDIDVLVHERDSEKAKSVLVDGYGYVYHGKGSHDKSTWFNITCGINTANISIMFLIIDGLYIVERYSRKDA